MGCAGCRLRGGGHIEGSGAGLCRPARPGLPCLGGGQPDDYADAGDEEREADLLGEGWPLRPGGVHVGVAASKMASLRSALAIAGAPAPDSPVIAGSPSRQSCDFG
jgi:hypothetical protein